ncbi:MAG: carbamate kinase [Acidimicrobiales bacterium]
MLGAETQGMIGYWLLQALENALPGRLVASLVCQTVVDVADPAFLNPTKFVGAVYSHDAATRLAADNGWDIRPDGDKWRRVVPSPNPLEIVELEAVSALLHFGIIPICSGGGGIPVIRREGAYEGVEAVIDKDLAASLLAIQIGAEALLLLTDVPAVMRDYGSPKAEPIHQITPQGLRSLSFPAGSMGPKVEAVCRFVEQGGLMAAIGSLADARELLEGRAGTVIRANAPGSTVPTAARTTWCR